MDPAPHGTPRVTTSTYDAEARLVGIRDEQGHLTTLPDEAVAEPGGRRTTYTYDAAGRLVGVTDPWVRTTSSTWAAAAGSTPPAAAPPTVLIELGGQTLRVAATEGFWVEGRGPTAAAELVAGDHLRGGDGRVRVVTRVGIA